MNIHIEKRDVSFDIAKGMGILLVIMGHMPRLMPVYIKAWIDSFHIPFFFLIAGYFAKPFDDTQSIFNRIEHAAKRLLLPYLAYSIVFTCFWGIVENDKSFWIEQIQSIVGGYGGHYALWFLFSLFLMEMVFLILSKFLCNHFSRVIIVLVLIIIGYAMNELGFRNAYTIGTSLYGYGFYEIGHILKTQQLKNIILSKKYVFPSIMISVMGSMFLLCWGGNTLEMISNFSNDIVLNYCVALSGIFLIVYIADNFKVKVVKDVLGYIGGYSLYFYPITAFVPDYCKVLFGDVTIVKILGRVVAFPITWLVIKLKELIKR